MREQLDFYIDGAWCAPVDLRTAQLVNPASEEVSGIISMGDAEDVDRAVKAARRAFTCYSRTTREERIDLLGRIVQEYQRRHEDLASAITEEMGAPAALARTAQTAFGLMQFQTAIEVLKTFRFEEDRGTTRLRREPIGVCGFITPWNWPINQIACKVAPALATGCTMVLKPSELAPYSAHIFAEILHAAGTPPGVFNLVNGDGPGVGGAISRHPEIDLVSITGSTRAGVDVAIQAAPSVKRVCQELGGKSPNIILENADFNAAVASGVAAVMLNSGQTCAAPTRMIVPRRRLREVAQIAKQAVQAHGSGDLAGDAAMGPVVSRAQWEKIQNAIRNGMEEGASVLIGGPGRPKGHTKGYYVRPTIFTNVTNDMSIARREIFGPVLCIIAYDEVHEAVAIANDTDYGLAAFVFGNDLDEARAVAAQLRAGQVILNGAPMDLTAPFGGFKQSGNGREWGEHGFNEFLELKAVMGFNPPSVTSAPAKTTTRQTATAELLA